MLIKNGRVVVEELNDPIIGANQLLVANMYSAVSVGTERSIILKAKKGSIKKLFELLTNTNLRKKALRYVRSHGIISSYESWKKFSSTGNVVPLGYSSVGVVLQVGKNVTDISVGDIVACAGAGYANHAELVAVPRNLVAKVPSDIDLVEASFTTIGSIALHALRLSGIQPGEIIGVIGVGLIGLIAVQLAKNVFSTKTIAFDINDIKLKLAEKLKADKTFVISEDNEAKIIREVFKFTNNMGLDAVIVAAATKSSTPVNLALELVRNRGRIIIIGDVGMEIDRDLMYRKEASVIVSRSYGPGRYDILYEVKGLDYPIEYVRWTLNRNMLSFLDFLQSKKVTMKPLISRIVSLDQAPKVYEEIVKGAPYTGVVISYDYKKYLNKPLTYKIFLNPKPLAVTKVKSRKVKLGIIGVGHFVSSVILPILKDLSQIYEIIAVATAHPKTSKEAAKKTGALYGTTKYDEILNDQAIDAVIIATPHNTHARLVMEAIEAKKAIFVEKPLAINEQELDKIYETYKKSPVPITVDFNRRFSPFMYEIRKLIPKSSPIYGVYRINAGFIPPSHWVQDMEIGGGRIIGEVCHFVDFFNTIIREPIKELDAHIIPPNNKDIVAYDNVSITLKWRNGSLTNIHYTSLGSSLLSKEYIELHFQGSSIVIEDFIKMVIFGEGGKRVLKLRKQDKGHKRHLVEFAKLVRGSKSDIPPFEEYINSMKLTFEIEKRLRRLKQI